MKHVLFWLSVIFSCVLATGLGAFFGAVAGVGIASLLMRHEEAVVLTTGVSYGAPLGGLLGVILRILSYSHSENDSEAN